MKKKIVSFGLLLIATLSCFFTTAESQNYWKHTHTLGEPENDSPVSHLVFQNDYVKNFQIVSSRGRFLEHWSLVAPIKHKIRDTKKIILDISVEYGSVALVQHDSGRVKWFSANNLDNTPLLSQTRRSFRVDKDESFFFPRDDGHPVHSLDSDVGKQWGAYGLGGRILAIRRDGWRTMIRFGSRRVSELEVHPTMDVIFSIDGDANVDLIDIYAGRIVRTYELQEGANRATALAVSPNGRYIAVSGDVSELVKVWDYATHAVVFVHATSNSSSGIHALAFSPDSSLLACASQVGQVDIIDFLNFQTVGVLQHSAAVYSVVFSRSGRFVAAGAADGTIRLWQRQ